MKRARKRGARGVDSDERVLEREGMESSSFGGGMVVVSDGEESLDVGMGEMGVGFGTIAVGDMVDDGLWVMVGDRERICGGGGGIGDESQTEPC